MKKLAKLTVAFVLLSVIFTAVSCSPNTGDKAASQNGSTYPLTVEDFMGREIVIEKMPERIVSLSPSTTELLFALGVGDRVVGVTDFDNYPPQVKDIAKVGGFAGPNMEAIVAQKPDLVFASSLSGKDTVEALQQLEIPVLVLEARTLDQIYRSIELIGRITGTVQSGEKIIREMKNKVSDIRDRVSRYPKVKVFYLVDINGNFTAGKGTFIDELISLAGGVNVAGDVEGWVQYSVEKLLEDNPDVIITAPHAGDVESIKNMPGYKDTTAVKQGKIFVVSDDNIISRASNRIVLGLEEIAKFLHPEAFK